MTVNRAGTTPASSRPPPIRSNPHPRYRPNGLPREKVVMAIAPITPPAPLTAPRKPTPESPIARRSMATTTVKTSMAPRRSDSKVHSPMTRAGPRFSRNTFRPSSSSARTRCAGTCTG